MNRRTFVTGVAAGVAGSALGCVAYAIGVEPHWLQLEFRDLPIRGLPWRLDGIRLAQISDLHVGPRVSDVYLGQSFARVRALEPDIVVFTGDFITYREERGDSQFDQLSSVLSGFPKGRLATVGILGNHDYGRAWREPDVAKRVVAEAERAGIRILRNETSTVDGLDVVGVDDLWARQCQPSAALSTRQGEAAIALIHNPDAADRPEWSEYEGWLLAGHTHGGQCKAPFLPPPLLPVQNRRYVAGEVAVAPDRTLYISRGVGHLIRARFNVRPEITLFTLRRVVPPRVA